MALAPRAMHCSQTTISLQPHQRGIHLITAEVVAALSNLKKISKGICHLFIQHTSASLAINENADRDVRLDIETFLNRHIPDDSAYFRHTVEGPDDMPAHIKAILIGSSLSIPITGGRLNLGTWQGIYLCEHRNRASVRRLIATIWGET